MEEGLLTLPLSVLNLWGMWLLGRKNRLGWLVTIFGEICWGLYGGWTTQYGLCLGGFVTAAVQVRAWWKWQRNRRIELRAIDQQEETVQGTQQRPV